MPEFQSSIVLAVVKAKPANILDDSILMSRSRLAPSGAWLLSAVEEIKIATTCIRHTKINAIEKASKFLTALRIVLNGFWNTLQSTNLRATTGARKTIKGPLSPDNNKIKKSCIFQ